MGVLFAWAGRLVLLGFGVWALTVGVPALADPDLDLLALFVGIAMLAGLVASFGVDRALPVVVAAVWAFLTYYALTALLDPWTVIDDATGGSRGPDIETPAGARVLGAGLLTLANGPIAWLT